MDYSKILYFCPAIIGIFFLLVPFNSNIIEATITDFLFVFSIFVPLILLFSIIIRIIIKEKIKSLLISSLAIILFFMCIPTYNVFFDNGINGEEITNQIILLVMMFSIFLGGVFLLIKLKKNFENILKIIFVIALSLVIFNIAEIEYFYFTNDLFSDNSMEYFSVDQNILRDVYHIIIDAHASTPALKQYFNYDNSDFENNLRDKGFFIPEFTLGNYNMTAYAIPSILNMDYVSSNWKSEKELAMIVKEMMVENSVTKNFQRNGYTTISFHNEYNLELSENSVTICDSNVRSIRLLIFYIDNTPFTIIKNLVFLVLDQTSNSEQGDFSFQPVIENRVCAFNELLNMGETYPQPIFVHAHLIMPHSPFIFDSSGSIINTRMLSEKDMPAAYLAQLQYTDTKIEEIIEKLLDNEPEPIIIIQSDHGFRFKINENDDTRKHAFLNFEAFYFPDKNLDKEEYKILSPVNTFRIVFNEYFGTNYDLLENKAFLIEDSKFVDVTDFVKSNSIFKED